MCLKRARNDRCEAISFYYIYVYRNENLGEKKYTHSMRIISVFLSAMLQSISRSKKHSETNTQIDDL